MSKKEEKVEARTCSVCGRDIYDFMEYNCKIYDELGMCAVCCHGEADLIDD